jgi:hypothetical protein
MRRFLKCVGSFFGLALCAARLLACRHSYRTAYSVKAPVKVSVVLMEGHYWLDDAFYEYVLQAPGLEHYAGYQRGGWMLDVRTIRNPMNVPEDVRPGRRVWPVALLLAALAPAPWVRWRFRIGTLLLATAIVAMWLALLVN